MRLATVHPSGIWSRMGNDHMSTRSMDVFALRDSVVGEYKKFATSFTTIYAEDLRRQVEAIYASDRYWPEPLIQVNPNYRQSTSVDRLVSGGTLEAQCAKVFSAAGTPLTLFKHQEQAIALASQGASFVVTTGTGSGKSLCFFIPIVNAVLIEKRQDPRPRTRAIIVYPMNALANSQEEELRKFVENVAGPAPITFARYTGQEKAEERQAISKDPPDILLTNFMMLELLMTRQDELDRRVIGNCAGLRFLVLDELHTYRGRQGADVALLVRRVRERLSPERLQCIGTSATMASEGTQVEKNRAVAEVASKLFSVPIPESNIVVETLTRVTEGTSESIRSHLGSAIDAGISPNLTDAQLKTHPLAVWVETRLGISFSDPDQRWVRAKPLTVMEAVETLSQDSSRSPEACSRALRDLLLVSSLPETERTRSPAANGRSFFAFKLHQFISGAGNAFATLEAPGRRVVTVDGQVFLPGAHDKRLYPVHFCRDCGHEYHPVRFTMMNSERLFVARDIDDALTLRPDDEADADGAEEDDDRDILGFLTPHSTDAEFEFDDHEEDYPESWLEYDKAGRPRLKSLYRKARTRAVFVEPSGRLGSGIRAWFIPGKFRFCLRCGATQGRAGKDRNRLAALSAEGRSSATTVLVSSVLRWMHGADSGLDPWKRKLLGFSDNRQDTALQAGHFNDFLFVSLIRAGFLGALTTAGPTGLRNDQLGSSQQIALGFDRLSPEIRAEWLQEPDLRGFNLQEAENTLRQILAYRVWFDQRRGWRYTNPNLEQLGLLRVEYSGLQAFAADESLFTSAPAILRNASPAIRANVYREIFDHLRKSMAVKSQVLDAITIGQMQERSFNRLRVPWGFGPDEKPAPARCLMVNPPARDEIRMRDEDLIARGGSRSVLGRVLKSSELWGGDRAIREIKAAEFDALLGTLFRAASKYGMVTEEITPFGQTGWKLNADCVVFHADSPEITPVKANQHAFFRDLYTTLAEMLRHPGHPLFGLEAREHTAQVDGDRREIREKRFRYGEKEQHELAADEKRLRELREANRFLPVLFCSPTMELGVDISALNAVYMRNVPPTPANYAQRSGRAGRSGQGALALTYCSAQGPHDQYFFQRPKEMVHGEVRPPSLDLANRELIESHMHAVWLASTGQPLDAAIAKLLVLSDPERPLRPEMRTPLAETRVLQESTERIKRVLDLLAEHLTPALAPWYPGRDELAASIAEGALVRFERAFGRWRDLFVAAENQRDNARRTMDDYSAPQKEKNAAKSRHAQAMEQLDLLQKGTDSLSSDFYTYRYLATEGFLPGYNFPRLPLMAFVPSTGDGKTKQTYLQRPRFLALAEFGPRSLVYHEGRAYRVVKAMLSLGQRAAVTADSNLPVESVRICKACGAGHFNSEDSMCHSCGAPLGDAEVIRNIYRIYNVATQPAERITANDEERKRQGFELQTTYVWAMRDHLPDIRRGTASNQNQVVADLTYGAGATITRLNKGLRRRADRTRFGFCIDPIHGYWARDEDDGDDQPDPTAKPRQWIVPCVRDFKNALLLRPRLDDAGPTALATIQHALLRGVELVFQLESGEVLAEPMPGRDERSGFLLYEATEGGAGVLTRLVAEPTSLAEVAWRALEIMHFDVENRGNAPAEQQLLTDIPGTACVAACYKCLMSYYNQPDHELLDRRDEQARAFLLRLARSQTNVLDSASPVVTDAPVSADPNLARWLALARAKEIPAPDGEPLVVGDDRLPLVWRAHYVAATISHLSEATASTLAARGFDLIQFDGPEETWADSFRRLAAALGRSQ
jgi:superfamily II DNA/RNA helicase